jgi:hypothetical protein
MMATAAMAAGAGIKVAIFGDAAKLESLADVFGDGLLHFVHVFLRVEKTLGHRVVEEGFAELLESGDFSAVHRHTRLLLLLQGLAFDHEGIVLAAKFVIRHEGLDLPPDGLDFRLVQNGLAEFPGFLGHEAWFSLCLHDIGCVMPGRGILPFKASDSNTPQPGPKIK